MKIAKFLISLVLVVIASPWGSEASAANIKMICRAPLKTNIQEMYHYAKGEHSTIPVMTFRAEADFIGVPNTGPFGRDLKTGECGNFDPKLPPPPSNGRLWLDLDFAYLKQLNSLPDAEDLTLIRTWDTRDGKWKYIGSMLFGLESSTGLFDVEMQTSTYATAYAIRKDVPKPVVRIGH